MDSNKVDKRNSKKRKRNSENNSISRYPVAFAGKNAGYTSFKHMYIFQEYENARREIRDLFPELLEYIPKKYYYTVVADRLGLSLSYVNVIIARVKKENNHWILNDEYNQGKREEK